MNTIDNIIIPFDLSETSDYALKFALSLLTENYKPNITAIHSCNKTEESETIKKLEKNISIIKEEYPYARDLEVKLISRPDPLIDSIITTKAKEKADLIIMGTKCRDHKDNVKFSNTSELVLEADCPVLVVPETIAENGINKIALMIGKENIDDPKALMTLLILARKFKAKVYALTIVGKDGNYGYAKEDENNENTLQYYLENFYSQHVFRESDDLEQGIFDFVKDNEIDMIAILPSTHAKKHSPSEGKLTRVLSLFTKVPLLTLD